MIDIKLIREHPDSVRHAAANRGAIVDVDAVITLDERRKKIVQEIEVIRAEKNTVGGEVTTAADKTVILARMKDIDAREEILKPELKKIDDALTALLYTFPNIPFPEVPVGKNETNNIVVRTVGAPTTFAFRPKSYLELGEALDLIDTERAAKISGARFGYLKGGAALLEFALVQFVFQRLSNEAWLTSTIAHAKLSVQSRPFTPLVPPVLISPKAFRAMGKLDPGQEEERYFLPKDDLYLVGSAEHSTGSMYMNESLDEEDLPKRYVAFSTCFRREAGSYGKDTRGIIRVHQFDKLEMMSFAHPEHAQEEHEFFRSIQEAMMQELKIPYRLMLICTGDMVWTDAKQYDIETWFPGEGKYRETHSTSNSTSFQSRRLHTRFRSKGAKKLEFVHTVNGTAFAIGRMLIAIMENYQQEDGRIAIPDALQPYMGGRTCIEKQS